MSINLCNTPNVKISDMFEDYENDSTPKLRPVRRPKIIREYIGENDILPERVVTCLKRSVCPFVPSPITSITNIDGYIWGMGFTGEKEKLIRSLYTPIPTVIEEPIEKLVLPSSNLLHVFSSMKVLKNGQVRLKFTVPMEPVHEYEKKGKLAPLDVRIKAAKGFGYQDTILTKMIQHHDKQKDTINKLDTFIDTIFGKSVNAKASKPKVKTIQEALNSKFKKKPAKKY